MSNLAQNKSTTEGEGTTPCGPFRLGCCHCERTDFDGIESFPSDWKDIHEVTAKGMGIWETHLGVCPLCDSNDSESSEGADPGPPPWEEDEELEKPEFIHPIVKQIISRDCHVGESNQNVVRHVISKLRGGNSTFRKMPSSDRRLLVEQCIEQHRLNFKEYVEVMRGFTHTTDHDPLSPSLPASLTGKELVALMRKHKVTIESLAFRVGTSMKRVRKLREIGIQDPLVVRDWLQAISGEDPGPIPSRFVVNTATEEGECCFCGYPLYVDDTAYEYAGSMFCSVSCCRKSRGW